MKKYILIPIIGAFFLLSFKAGDYFEISKNLEIFAEVYKEVNTTYVDEVKPGELIRAAIDGMLKSLDPYTNFYSEAQAEDYKFQVTGTYSGIGASIRRIENRVYIDSPLEGRPCQKARLFYALLMFAQASSLVEYALKKYLPLFLNSILFCQKRIFSSL